MTAPERPRPGNLSLGDPALADWIAELADRLASGEAVDLEAYARAHPERADALRRYLPAIEMMADLGLSVARGETAAPRGGLIAEMGTLGDFRLIREVGRGGMGIVYEAEQLSLRRRVALKLLPFAAAMDPRRLQRFQVEAQAAALLHHTHIVPVHAVGAERGIPYYAMQFIEGRTLAEIIRELRQLAEPDRRGRHGATRHMKTTLSVGGGGRVGSATEAEVSEVDFSLATEPPADPCDAAPSVPSTGPTGSRAHLARSHVRTAVTLALHAAEAVEHAHEHGVVHRDIKPANLMVDVRGHLWVTDFGLARLLGAGELTASGDLLGTLRYMSPEQTQGGGAVVDHRTDIYSLGATLYELLTLAPAVCGGNQHEILSGIESAEPRPPRKLNPAVPVDLETVVLKALAKEPERRYATARELAEDLRRILEDKPVRARRPSPVERLERWVRRHRVAVEVGSATTCSPAPIRIDGPASAIPPGTASSDPGRSPTRRSRSGWPAGPWS